MSIVFASLISTSQSKTALHPPALTHHNSIFWNNTLYLFNGKFLQSSNAVPHGSLEDKMYKYSFHEKQNAAWKLAGTENVNQPVARYGASAVLRKDSVIVFGGCNLKGDLLSDLWEFNLKSETWSQITPSSGMIGPRAFHQAVYIQQHDALYIFFGKLKNGLSHDVHKFSFKNESWELVQTKGKPPSERQHAALTISDDQHSVYCFGGKSTKGKHDDFYRLDMSTLTWHEITTPMTAEQKTNPAIVPSPPKMQGHIMYYDRDHIMVHGGSYASRYVYDYSVHDKTWTKVMVRGHQLFGRDYHSVSYIGNGKHVVYGGYREDMTRPKNDRIQLSNSLECVQSFQFKHQDSELKHVVLNKMRKNGQLIDLQFLVGKLKKPYECHQVILQRSPQLARLIEEARREQDTKLLTIQLAGVDTAVFEDFLNWMYENKLSSIYNIIDLCKMARAYEIYDLVMYCAREFQESISFKNVISLLIEVEEKKEDILRLLCQSYIFDHYSQIMTDANNVQQLSKVPNLLQEVMLLSREKRPAQITQKFPELKDVRQDAHYMFDRYLNTLWKRKNAGDLKLVGKDSGSFQVHAVLLAAQSPVFLEEFSSKTRTVMKIKAESSILEKLIEFTYKGRVDGGESLDIQKLQDIALVAHKWMPSVEDWAIERLLDKVNKSTATTLLSVCRTLKSLENIEVLKQVCKLEMVQRFNVHELSEMIADLLANG